MSDIGAQDPISKKPSVSGAAPAATTGTAAEPATDAERIARLQQTIREDQKRLALLRSALEKLGSEFESISKEFARWDERVADKTNQLEALSEEAAASDAGTTQPIMMCM